MASFAAAAQPPGRFSDDAVQILRVVDSAERRRGPAADSGSDDESSCTSCCCGGDDDDEGGREKERNYFYFRILSAKSRAVHFLNRGCKKRDSC